MKTKKKTKRTQKKIEETETFKMTRKMWIAFSFLTVGIIMIIFSFFINDPPLSCNASITATIFTPSYILIICGILFVMVGIAMADVEYHTQTGWVMKRLHKKRW